LNGTPEKELIVDIEGYLSVCLGHYECCIDRWVDWVEQVNIDVEFYG
jgi:hypothetical protein